MTFEFVINHAPKIIVNKLEQLKTMRERPDFHPEPSTFEHVKIVTTRLIQSDNPNLIMTGVLHDICKFDCIKINGPDHKMAGFPTSPGHDDAAERLIRTDEDVQNFIRIFKANVDTVAWLCGQHMRVKQINDMRASKQAAFRAMDNFSLLEMFTVCDNMLISDEQSIREMKAIQLAGFH